MNITHIEHIGIAVENLQEAIQFYENVLGLSCYRIEEVSSQKVRTAFFQVGQTKIELLEAMASDSPISKFLEKRGPGIHHLAFAVPEVQAALDSAAEKEVTLIDKSPRLGAENLQTGFLHPKSTIGVLLEFCGKQ
jgi:methylmalonyl-CoA/ethylmalonyl-CoA epimerase